MPLLRPKRSAITFDIGRTGLRAVQVFTRGREPRVRQAVALDLSEPREAGLLDSIDAAFERVARQAETGGFVGREIAVLLSPPEARFHPMCCPEALLSQPEDRIEDALLWELAREFRVEAESLEVRFWRLPPGHRERLNVMAAYTERALIEALLHSAAARGLTLRSVNVEPAALARVCLDHARPTSGDIWAIADVAHHGTTITTLLGDVPVYIRSLPRGADMWVEQLCEASGLTQGAATRMLFSTGQDSAPDAGRKQCERALAAILNDAIPRLSRDVQVCLDYVIGNYPQGAPKRVYLAGRGGCMPGLAEGVERRIGLSTAAVNRIGPDAGTTGELAAALGCALCELEPAP